MSMTPVHRPFGVSLLSILLIIAGVFDIIGGLVLIFTRNDSEIRHALRDVSSGSITTYGVVTIILGVVVLLIGLALRNGAGWARALVAIVAVFRVGVLIWGVAAYHSFHWYQALLPAAIYLLIAGYLYMDEDAKGYFDARATA